jgi:hypothetical protein
MEPLTKINTLKMNISKELGIANNVNFTLIDIRVCKKPKLCELFKLKKRKAVLQEICEIEYSKVKKMTLADFS